jgi:hypothetical protein
VTEPLPNDGDLDPQELIEQADYDPPEDDPVDDEPRAGDPSYVEPVELGEALPRGTVLQDGYVGARSCSGGPTPGSTALMSVFLGRYGARGGRNLGIYNCRSVRGAPTLSLHGEGRAGDHGCPVGSDWMQEWCDLLVAYSAELGIQCVIYNRRIWSSSYAGQGWRRYTGVNPHTDHAHVEQTPGSADTLTAARVVTVLAPTPAPRPPAPRPPAPAGRPTLRRGSTGAAVVELQRGLVRVFPAYRHEHGNLPATGNFLTITEAWVREFQRNTRLGADGVVGPGTWAKLDAYGVV